MVASVVKLNALGHGQIPPPTIKKEKLLYVAETLMPPPEVMVLQEIIVLLVSVQVKVTLVESLVPLGTPG